MNKNKTTFKILLNSFITTSYVANNNNHYNAKYYVDLKDVINNDEDLDKSYNVYVSFRSTGAALSNGINNADTYLLNIDFSKMSNTVQYQQQNKPNRNICNIIPVSITLERTASTTSLFDLKETEQNPTKINNIRSINFITLNLITADTYETFAMSSGSKYVCILTFLEI